VFLPDLVVGVIEPAVLSLPLFSSPRSNSSADIPLLLSYLFPQKQILEFKKLTKKKGGS
jgi:hypothetical protein